ncbi:MAG: hypothetical protein H7Y04_10410 [Verrucomicrobia bacterium]|nr:hypothetical protein [Cytophagales bacterium]
MKISVCFCLLLLCLNACYTPFKSYQNGYNGLKTAPQPPPHKNEVKIYFPGEKISDTNYVKMTVLEVRSDGETSYNNLISMIKRKAQLEGVDAVVLLGKEEEKISSTSGGSYVSTTVYTEQILSGLGIRYRNNFDYVKMYPKKAVIHQINTDNNSQELPTETVLLDFDRQVINTNTENDQKSSITLYKQYVEPYTPFELLEAKKGWAYSASSNEIPRINTNLPFQVLQKVYPANSNSGFQKKYSYTYENERISKVTMKRIFKSVYKIEKADLNYNKENQVKEIFTRQSNKLQFKHVFEYDAEGRITGTDVYRIIDKKSSLFLKVSYEFHTAADLNF